MPTCDRQSAIGMDEARERAGSLAFPPPRNEALIGGVGLEPELFPIVRDSDGRPFSRMMLTHPGGTGVLEVVDTLAQTDDRIGPRTSSPPGPVEYPVEGGGRLTFEPGAQVEHSTAVFPSVATVIADVDDVLARVRRAFRGHDTHLAAVGIDIWNDVETVPQQLRAGRYTAQAAYYRQRGHWGAVMMRQTASLQINLDLGPEGVWQERWLLSNLMSPLMTATFASSPGAGAVCSRARAWQELDPTRSGFPSLLVDGTGDDPRSEWGQAALDADVMLYRVDERTSNPGAWAVLRKVDRQGHPRWGWPPPRSRLPRHDPVLRGPAAGIPRAAGRRSAAESVAAGTGGLEAALFYESMRAKRPGLLGVSGVVSRGCGAARLSTGSDDETAGPRVQAVGDRSRRHAGAAAGYVGEDHVAATRDYLEHFTEHGRTPGDDLLDLDNEDPAVALEWASS